VLFWEHPHNINVTTMTSASFTAASFLDRARMARHIGSPSPHVPL
jgi:hypothetical protein